MTQAASSGLQPDTPSHRNLVRWMAAGSVRERGQTAIARALGVSQASVRQWIVLITRPTEQYRAGLEILTGGKVKAAGWELREEKQARDRALQKLKSAKAPASP